MIRKKTERFRIFLIFLVIFGFMLMIFGCVGVETQPAASGESITNFPKMNVGDTWTRKVYQWGAKGSNDILHSEVIEVGQDGSFVVEVKGEKSGKHRYLYINNKYQTTKVRNLKTGKEKMGTTARMDLNFPLYTGKKWKCQFNSYSVDGTKYDYEYSYSVEKYERVTLEAGSFDAFRIEVYGVNRTSIDTSWRDLVWYAPEVKRIVLLKRERVGIAIELLSYKLATTDESKPVVKKAEPKPEPQIKKAIPEPAKPIEKPKILVKGERIKIGILEFQSLNKEARNDELGKIVSEMLTTSFVNSEAFKIIEKDQLQKIVKELELSQSGIIDTPEVKKIGEIAGATAIVTGSVVKIKDYMRLDARIIDVESGIIITAEKSEGIVDLKSIGSMVNSIVENLVNKFNKEKE